MSLPPLVAPADALPTGEVERASRQLRMLEIGEVGQRRLVAARVCVLGAGGLGSPALLYLAGAGVGTIGIVDDDDVDTSNLQRQIVHGASTVGEPKAASATARIHSLSPHTRVIEHCDRLTAANARAILSGYDLVLDGADTFETRYLVSDVCTELGIPVVWATVLRFDAQVSVFWSRPPAGVPAVTLRDVFPAAPPADEVPSCSVAGVLGPLCGQAGSIMAAEAIKLICGIGTPLIGRMLVIDALGARTTQVPISGRTDAIDDSPTDAPIRTPLRNPAVATVTVAELADLIASDAPVDVIDVREPAENADVIPGSRPVALGALLRDADAAGDTGSPIVVYCEEGPRARAAVRTLVAAGRDARVLDGGMTAWRQAQTSDPSRGTRSDRPAPGIQPVRSTG